MNISYIQFATLRIKPNKFLKKKYSFDNHLQANFKFYDFYEVKLLERPTITLN